MFAMRKYPSEPVVVPCCVPEGSWTATTVAPGSGSPLSSMTEPARVDVVTPCAKAAAGISSSSSSSANRDDRTIVDSRFMWWNGVLTLDLTCRKDMTVETLQKASTHSLWHPDDTVVIIYPEQSGIVSNLGPRCYEAITEPIKKR